MMQELAYDEKMFTKARETVKGQGGRLHLMAAVFKPTKIVAIAGRGVIHQRGNYIGEGCREETRCVGSPPSCRDPCFHNVAASQTERMRERESGN